jgi:hypothetical protein
MTARARRNSSFFGIGFIALVLFLAARGTLRGNSDSAIARSGTGTGGSTPAVAGTPPAAPGALPYTIPANFAVTAIRAGLGADELAAVGVSAQQVLGVMQPLADSVNQAPSALSAADESFATARRETDRLQRLIQSGKGTQEDVSAYQTQKAALATATSSRETILENLRAAAAVGLSSGQRLALTRIRANKHWSLPTEFLVIDRSEQEWVTLRDALANERISAKIGEAPDPESQAALAILRAQETVAAAHTALESNRTAVRAAWRTATGD